jgi:hypothetical protein
MSEAKGPLPTNIAGFFHTFPVGSLVRADTSTQKNPYMLRIKNRIKKFDGMDNVVEIVVEAEPMKIPLRLILSFPTGHVILQKVSPEGLRGKYDVISSITKVPESGKVAEKGAGDVAKVL